MRFERDEPPRPRNRRMVRRRLLTNPRQVGQFRDAARGRIEVDGPGLLVLVWIARGREDLATYLNNLDRALRDLVRGHVWTVSAVTQSGVCV